MKKIAILSPYFGGTLPNYFNLFLKSCEKNPTIDFFVFTDCDIENEKQLADNIKIVHYSFDQLREKIQKVFDFEINLTRPYQICNFYPASGLIFEEEFKPYDFWGHCDCDMILGQLREKITDDVLEKHERIYSWGHLSLYKNDSEVNRRFMLPLNGETVYKEMLTSNMTNAFDEWGPKGISWIYKEHQLPIYSSHDMANVKIDNHEFILDADPESTRYRQIFVWDNGNLYREYIDEYGKQQKELFNYIHLQKRPMKINTDNKEKYLIVPNQFIDYPSEGVTAELIKKYSRHHFIYWNNVKRWYQGNVIRRVKKLNTMIFKNNENFA